jgi:hypothetical protein
MMLLSNPLILAYLSPPFDCFYLSQLPYPLVPSLILVNLYPLVPIYLLLDFKYVHFENPFAFNSKVIFFSPLVANIRLFNLVPHKKNGSNNLLQEVKPEQLKTMLHSQTLHLRSQYSAGQAERDA